MEPQTLASSPPDLAGRAIAGDPAALQDLWRIHRAWVAAVLLAHMPRDAELDDLLQEVALTMIRKVGELRDPALLKPWLRTIAVNAAITAGRRRTVRLRLVRPAPDAFDAPAPASSASDATVRAMNAEEARRAIELARSLPPDYAEPLLMRCVHAMNYQQIADALQVPVTTIETRLARARRMLREAAEGRDASRPAHAAAR